MRRFYFIFGLCASLFSFVSCDKQDLKDDYQAVDLGLSVKWATHNIGAEKPEEAGVYFSWGETRMEVTRPFLWDTYKWGKKDSLTKYCTEAEKGVVDNRLVLDENDDAAYVCWGGNWRMPSTEEFEELIERCDWEWVELNNQLGYEVIGPNGNSIFLPAAGAVDANIILEFNKIGDYWTNELFKDDSNTAARFYFYNGKKTLEYGGNRYMGMTIRPVCDR
jgi:hypothetical protein